VRKLANPPAPPAPAHGATPQRAAPGDAPSAASTHPSKTRRKAEMHALQDLGEALVRLAPARLDALALPEKLADAVAEARGITKWEARRRQMQFIGRLMRDVDPLPIERALAEFSRSGDAKMPR
jgi:ribosome-associated protein